MKSYALQLLVLILSWYLFDICKSICLVQNKDILEACNIGHLTLLTNQNGQIQNEELCNRELSQEILNQKLNIKIDNYFSYEFSKNTTFALIMIDVTANKLLWMLSNLTSMNGEMTTAQNNIHNFHVVTLKDYAIPNLLGEHANATHLIQIFIFQEDKTNSSTQTLKTPSEPFYIRDWIMQSQSPNSKTILCGPIAGIQFKINKSPMSKDYKILKNLDPYVSNGRSVGLEFYLIFVLAISMLHVHIIFL